jgi:hypothetical protein
MAKSTPFARQKCAEVLMEMLESTPLRHRKAVYWNV